MGYPACAGIDPRDLDTKQMARWLPRMRGDRPKQAEAKEADEKATPHARGSTSLAFLKTCVNVGYPACAGIDPSENSKRSFKYRLPRMRGDRPLLLLPKRNDKPATPHARGSTSPKGTDPANTIGYPACAGIDL